MRYSDRMPRDEKRHVQMWLGEPLAAAVDRYAAEHGAINFTAAVSVLLARQLRTDGYLQGAHP
jgi:hypothetical protein